jgi:COMPASS component SWD3
VNKKFSLGGAFGVVGNEAYIVSGSEDGDVVFWDVKSKEMIQKASGHEGVVCWADTCPGTVGKVASGGLDGTVRIWVDVNEDEEGSGGINGLKLEEEDESMADVKVENGAQRFDDDTPRDDDASMDGTRTPKTDEEPSSPDRMDEE